MSLNYDSLIAVRRFDQPLGYTERDAMLYALGVGFCNNIGYGYSGADRRELNYAFEVPNLKTVPTMASALLRSEMLADVLMDFGLRLDQVLLTAQRLELYRPLPAASDLLANTSVDGIHDSGRNGVSIELKSELRLARDDTALFTLGSTLLARGDTGIVAPPGNGQKPHILPSRRPDLSCTSDTRPDQALLFRLCDGRSPLHADADAARRSGFERPPLQERCTYGLACRAILQTICDLDHTLITGIDARFSAPVYPGDSLTTDMWQDRNIVSFRCTVKSRNSVVVDNGKCTLVS